MDEPGRVTEVLAELRKGAPEAQEELFRLIYGELRRLADSYMRNQPSDHTLQPTALVNEAYLRLMRGADAPWNDRAHFLTAAARAMRSILVDFARRRKAQKRGGGRGKVTLDESAHAGKHPSAEVVAVHDALEKLEEVDPQGSRIVELRFFGGLSMEEAARILEISEATAYRSWNLARSWLYREIAG
jgi:RNA polymerase sigma factor (TIGR02999 family)